MGVWSGSDASVALEAAELREEILRRMRAALGGESERKSTPRGSARRRTESRGGAPSEDDEVCVTGGLSFLGSSIVGRLLDRGYAVRLVVASREEFEKVAEMGTDDGRLRPVVAEAMDVEGLRRAFDGCAAVFHTSAAVDPSGLSGYSKRMADVEVRAAERVMEACVRAESVKRCVFTSSLTACVWRCDGRRRPSVVDESCWSDEDLCREKKLWFALGKTMAEKAAWRIAQGRRDLKLVAVCPALLTGSGFARHNSTASIAYLKGSRELLAEGLLATADVETVADAHVKIYESMTASSSDATPGGRYICFDHLIGRPEEVDELEQLLGIARRASTETTTKTQFQCCRPEPAISKQKFSKLLMANSLRRCTYDVYSFLT